MGGKGEDATTGKEEARRALLFSARLRFSSPTQPVREAAIDRIVQQNLLLLDEGAPISAHELCKQGAFTLSDGTQVLQIQQVEDSLNRMTSLGLVKADGKEFSLTDTTRTPLEIEQKANQQRLDRVILKHLGGAAADSASINRAAFLDAIATIFSKLGEGYARIIQGDADSLAFSRGPLVRSVLDELATKWTKSDIASVSASVVTFLEDLSPDAASIKWNLGQNYYVAKALGLDQEGRLLSDEVFGGAEVYLDTNVVIPALEPRARHHGSFQILARACQGLEAQLCVCQVTVDETRTSVARRRVELEKVMDDIPDQLSERISNEFYEAVKEAQRKGKEPDLDEIFRPYEDPAGAMADEFGVELCDDEWFVSEAESEDTATVAKRVSDAWEERKGYPKSTAVARHDALLLRWVDKRRREDNERAVVLITQDHTLRPVEIVPGAEPPLSMMLDVFVQWVSPTAIRAIPNADFSAIFAEAIKFELLPQDNFLDLKDFLVFHEMEMSCKELPVEDVEACIQHLKKSMPHLDPRRAADREKLTAEINRFLVDPGRKYKLELERLEHEKEQLRIAADKRVKDERKESEDKLKEKDEELKSSHARIASLRSEAETGRSEALKSSARRRLAICLVGLIITLAGTLWWAFDSSRTSDSVWKVVSGATESLVIVVAVWLAIGSFVLGEDRIGVLDWPFKRLFGR